MGFVNLPDSKIVWNPVWVLSLGYKGWHGASVHRRYSREWAYECCLETKIIGTRLVYR